MIRTVPIKSPVTIEGTITRLHLGNRWFVLYVDRGDGRKVKQIQSTRSFGKVPTAACLIEIRFRKFRAMPAYLAQNGYEMSKLVRRYYHFDPANVTVTGGIGLTAEARRAVGAELPAGVVR